MKAMPVASWTYFYETQVLRDTLTELVDVDKLKQHDADPVLLVSATNVKEGQIKYFDSRNGDLSLDHILASGSLPPAFPMTTIGNEAYWDGGLFDNTPLGAVLDTLDPAPDRAGLSFKQRIREKRLDRVAFVDPVAAKVGIEIAAYFKLIELILRHDDRPQEEAALTALAVLSWPVSASSSSSPKR
jgi:Patatin-like phospholipase